MRKDVQVSVLTRTTGICLPQGGGHPVPGAGREGAGDGGI